MLRRFRLRNILEKILSIWSGFRTLAWCIASARELDQSVRRCQKVIFIPSAGFGHTIHDPDLARRFFQSHRCLLVFLSEPGRHNPEVKNLWSDVEVFFLPTGARIKFGAYDFRSSTQPRLHSLIGNWLKRKTLRVGGEFLPIRELYQRLLNERKWPKPLLEATAHLKMNFRWPIFYFHLREQVLAHRPRLLESIRIEIENKLPKANHRVGLYLRQKGAKTLTSLDKQRTGSPLATYLPALRHLVQSGFQVLLSGDEDLPRDFPRDLENSVFDARSVGVDKKLFDLYAATEVELFIGESGGGIWLPELSGIPVLMLNALPYSVGIPYAQIFYQLVRRVEDRKLVSLEQIYAQFPYEYLFKGFVLEKLAPEHLLAAVQAFLETRNEIRKPRGPESLEASLPADTWIRHSNSRFSPAFVDLYRREG